MKFILFISCILMISCSKPFYYKNIKHLNTKAIKSEHFYFEVSTGLEVNSQQVFITIYDVEKKLIYYCSNSLNINKISVDTISNVFLSKYDKFIFENIKNKNCDTILKTSNKFTMSGVHSKNIIGEFEENKIAFKCEFYTFILE